MPSDQPIGIFDSGIGGLTVLSHIRQMLPKEHLIYVSDRAHLPYGNKDEAFVLKRAQHITRFLMQRQVKGIVIACNTATAAAVKHLRAAYDLPIVGMEPGVKPAIQLSSRGRIGVLATQGTLSSGKFRSLLREHARESQVIICPCQGWVEAIEFMGPEHPETREIVHRQLQPVLESGVDTLVLGCTHYPFLKSRIEESAGSAVTIIDTGPAVARQLFRRLEEQDLLNRCDQPGQEEFWCSAPPEQTRELIERLRGQPTRVQALPEEPIWDTRS
ncbi:MAG: glutamate racemase [Candidatus Thiodiazotropha sp.]